MTFRTPLTACVVDRVLHGFTIHRQRLVVLAPRLVPGIERPIQRVRFNPHQTIADEKFAGHDIAPVLAPATEAFPRLLSQAFGPVVGGLVAAHPAQDGSRSNAQVPQACDGDALAGVVGRLRW